MANHESLRSGERRYVTVLFSDMKGFTSLSERLDPEDMDTLMSSVFAEFEAITRRHGGAVEKYIGDALVAVFGVPSIHEDDPSRAVSTAIAFGDEVKRLNRRYADRAISLEFRTGIHTGLITTGKRGEYDVVTGHAMSIASRLETEAPLGGVLVSEPTRLRCDQDFLFDGGRSVPIRGSAEPIRAFVVLGRNPNPMFGGAHFTNRENEIEELTRKFIRHDQSTANGVLLTGEPGIGKTRLVGHFIDRIRRFPDFGAPILTARARKYRDLNFAVIIDLLLTYFPFSVNDEVSDIAEQTQAAIDVDETVATGFARIVRGEDSPTVENQSIVVLYVVLKTIMTQHSTSPYPTLVVVDNISFLDEQSRDFIRFFLENSPVQPFFLFTARRRTGEITALLPNIDRVELNPLSQSAACELFDALWSDCKRPELRQTVLSNSNGNPLFIEEYVRYARDSSTPGTLPNTIQNIFLSSIDSYSPEMRELLKRLSVFRESFSLADAQYMQERTDGEPRMVESALSFFLREGIIIVSDGIYSFRHDVFKKALYDSLLNFNKRILHGIVADCMQKQEKPHIGRMLYHLTHAEKFAEAGSVLREADDRHLNLEYIPFIDLLIARLPGDDRTDRLQLMFLKSAINVNNGNMRESDSTVREMLDIAMTENNMEYAASAFHLLTGHNRQTYNFEKTALCGANAIDYYTKLIELSDDPASDQVHHWGGLRRNVRGIIAIASSLANDRAGAEEHLRLIEADETSRSADGKERHDSAVSWASYHLLFGEYKKGYDRLRPFLEPFEAEPDVDKSEAFYLGMLLSWQLCDYSILTRIAAKMARLPEQSYPRRHTNLSQIHAMLAGARHFLGERERVEEHLQQGEFYSLQIRNDVDRVDALRSLASAAMIVGDLDRAEKFARQCTSVGLRLSACYPTFSALVILAEIHFERIETEGCDFFLAQAESFVRFGLALPKRDLIIYNYLCYSRAAEKSEHSDRARTLLTSELQEMRDEAGRHALLEIRSLGRAAEATSIAHY